jgi:hypothetical protein
VKRILFLSYYFEPDLCAGSFRNSTLFKELYSQIDANTEVVVITTMPHRYASYDAKAMEYEGLNNIVIHRINIKKHKGDIFNQIKAFAFFYVNASKIYRKQKFDLVYASSSRLFTAFLGYRASRITKAKLYLDIRDIFVDTMNEVLKKKLVRFFSLIVLNCVERMAFSNANHINLISGGFKTYFNKYPKPNYSFFSNGIDDDFSNWEDQNNSNNLVRRIMYAGNIGEGQGLEYIIPQAAKKLEGNYEFIIIGDGGTRHKLQQAIHEERIKNVVIMNPVNRKELKEIYKTADFLFIHLNDYKAFEKVLPSKVFELAAINKPIIAGVSGYAYSFFENNIDNVILFKPKDVNSLITQLENYNYKKEFRYAFIEKYNRKKINSDMVKSILSYVY